jgi:hypothetical protein
VTRILAKTVDDLRRTDMADDALATLAHSPVTDIYLLGRRGPAQAAFTPKELKCDRAAPQAPASALLRPAYATWQMATWQMHGAVRPIILELTGRAGPGRRHRAHLLAQTRREAWRGQRSEHPCRTCC